MSVEFQPVEIPRDLDALTAFLCNDEWPFHARRVLTEADVAAIDFASSDVATFWIVDGGSAIGFVRMFDLGDIGDGSPLFDLRIAGPHRGRGIGAAAAQWLVDYLFSTYPELHRIEANTRHDNAAMQRVLGYANFSLEGRLRSAWRSDDGQWYDTMIYGVLRSDWRD